MAEQGREPALGCCSASAQVVWEQSTAPCWEAVGLLRESMCVTPSKLQFTQASK